jgi:hypothetical protein
VCTGCWWGSLRERGHWGDQDVNGRIILKWNFRKLEGVMGTGWSWLIQNYVAGKYGVLRNLYLHQSIKESKVYFQMTHIVVTSLRCS